MSEIKTFDKIPKYKRLADILQQEIVNSKFLPGDKFLTEFEIQKKYNVSRGIVREAILSLIQKNLVNRVPGKGTFVNSVNQHDAKDTHSSKLINVVVTWMLNVGMEPIVARAIEDVGFERGYQTVISSVDNDFEKLDKYFSQMVKNNATKGLTFIPLVGEHQFDKNIEFIRKVQENNIAIVVMDRLPYVNNEDKYQHNFDYVMSDHFQGGYLVTRHLVELGHRRIAYIGGQLAYSGQQRVNGYRKACEENKIEFDSNLIVRVSNIDDFWGNIIEVIKQLRSFKEPPTAIFAENDLLANAIMISLQKLGIKIPDEISVAGYDDLDFSKHLYVPLTTIRQPVYEMGKIAAEILIDKIEGKTKEIKYVVLPVELIVRQSTGPARK
jgi:GntR family transcriptional regulator, arabinose operon transcriptional repressor